MKFDLSLTLDDLDQSRSLTLTNLVRIVCFILPSHWSFLSPSLGPIGASWNLTWPWPLMTLTALVLNVRFILPSHPGSFSPSLSPIGARWNLTWPWPILFLMFVPYSRHVQVSCHQVWAQSGQVEIWPDLWPWGYLTLGSSDPITNINWHCLGPMCIHPPSFVSVGPIISEKIDGQTDRQTFPSIDVWCGWYCLALWKRIDRLLISSKVKVSIVCMKSEMKILRFCLVGQCFSY